MIKKNLIRLVNLALLPAMGMFSFGAIPNVNIHSSQIVLLQKENNKVLSFLYGNNDEEDNKLEILKLRGEAIDAYYRKWDMPLEGTGIKMAEEAMKYGLDWRIVAATSVIESTGGKFACKTVGHNPFGWASCRIGFESYEQAIEIVAMNMGGKNPKTADYYAGKDTKGILQAYNPPSIVPRYANKVMHVMDKIGPIDLGEKVIEKAEV